MELCVITTNNHTKIEIAIPSGITVEKVGAEIRFIAQKTGRIIMKITRQGINFYKVKYPYEVTKLGQLSSLGYNFLLIQRIEQAS